MAKKTTKALTPSRVRYEQSHPVISVRVDRELCDRLKDLEPVSGKSVADVLREALGQQEASANDAYMIGYDDGIEWADAEYRVDYRCSVCGGTMTTDTAEEKAAAAKYMREDRWHHGECRR